MSYWDIFIAVASDGPRRFNQISNKQPADEGCKASCSFAYGTCSVFQIYIVSLTAICLSFF